jgi:hypothetical protein
MEDKSLDKIKTVCCVCGKVTQEGKTINGAVSHGYCKECEAAERKKYGLTED